MGTNKKEIRTRLLSEPDLILDRTIDICRSTEQRDRQVDVIGSRKTTETVHYTQKAEKRKQRREHIKDCKFCRLSHDKGKCQAYGLTCAICLKHNHVARMCQSQAHPPWSNKLPAHAKVRYVNDEPASSDESIYALDPLSDCKHYYANIHVSPLGGQKALTLKFQIDTGASCSTLALVDYQRLTTEPLQPSHIKLKLYDNSILQPLGAVILWCEANNIKKKVHFQVVDNNSPSLLSGLASSALQLIAFNVECVRHLDEVKSLTKEGVLDNCKDWEDYQENAKYRLIKTSNQFRTTPQSSTTTQNGAETKAGGIGWTRSDSMGHRTDTLDQQYSCHSETPQIEDLYWPIPFE